MRVRCAGVGVCMEGNYNGQTYGMCALNNVNVTARWAPDSQSLPPWVTEASARVHNWTLSMQHYPRRQWSIIAAAAQNLGQPPPGSWHYLQCPPENECTSGLHHCRRENYEVCDDMPIGYRCNCTPGYNRTASCAIFNSLK